MKAAELRQFREALGLTQGELARRCGLHANNVSAMEAGRRPVGPGIRARLALMQIVRRLEGRTGPIAEEVRALVKEGLGG